MNRASDAAAGGESDSPHAASLHRRLALLMTLQFGAGGALFPFFGPYLRAKELDNVELTWIMVATSIGSSATSMLWGAVADRHVAVNRLLSALHLSAAVVLLIVVPYASSVIALALAFALYSSLQQPTNALVSALSFHNLEHPEREFGRLRLWGSVGWILPSLPISIWLAFDPTRSLDFVIGVTAVILMALVVCSPLWPHTPPAGARRRRFRSDLRALLGTPRFIALLGVAFLTMASFAIMFFFTSLAQENAGVPRPWLGPTQCIGVAIEIPLFLLLPGALKRLGYVRVIALGITAALVRHLIFLVSNDPWVLSAAATLIAPAVVFFIIGGSLAVDSIATREVRATAQSLFTIAGSGLGTVAGLLGSALITDRQTLTKLFALGAALAALALGVLYVSSRLQGRPPRQR